MHISPWHHKMMLVNKVSRKVPSSSFIYIHKLLPMVLERNVRLENSMEYMLFFLHLTGAVKDLQGESFTDASQGPWHFSARHYSSDGCNLRASACVSCPPFVEIAPVFLCFSLQLLHWKQRNVCGQDHRGQAAEGIRHPSEAWFWRYVEIRGCSWGNLRVGLFARCYLHVIPLEFVERGGLWQNTGKSFEVTTTMSLLCISSYIEDGCSSGSRAYMQESNQTHWFPFLFFFSNQAERVCWILILFLIRAACHCLCVTCWAFDLKIGENPSAWSTLTSFTSTLHHRVFWGMLKKTNWMMLLKPSWYPPGACGFDSMSLQMKSGTTVYNT